VDPDRVAVPAEQPPCPPRALLGRGIPVGIAGRWSGAPERSDSPSRPGRSDFVRHGRIAHFACALIAANAFTTNRGNGRVVAPPEGARVGRMTVTTRFFISTAEMP